MSILLFAKIQYETLSLFILNVSTVQYSNLKFAPPLPQQTRRSLQNPALPEGRGPERGPQEAVKAPGELSVSPLSYARISTPQAKLNRIQDVIEDNGKKRRRRSSIASLDVLIRARYQRWNYLGHILRMEEHRVTRQVLLPICQTSSRITVW